MLKFAQRAVILLSCLWNMLGVAQEARLRTVEKVSLPTLTDGNSPSFWLNDRLRLFTSIAWPVEISESDGLLTEWTTREVDITNLAGKAIWVESAWADDDGTVFGWYHTEPWGLYEDSLLTAPKIGAVISFDGGRTIQDLGVILETGDTLDDGAQNGCFTGGHGDFSVVLDRERNYFYFFFTNYGGPAESQGVVVARMAFADRFEPMGKVRKYYMGEWVEPGVEGRLTPVFPVVREWRHPDPDSFWGPSVHWNTYLNCFVMLLNHASGEPGWSQEGIYVAFAKDLTQPDAWKKPAKILDSSELADWGTFYPQVMGLEAGGTDTLAGKTARFFINGRSKWEIDFYSVTDAVPPKPIDDFHNRFGPKPKTVGEGPPR